jgi:hypothetical protein
VQFGKSDLAALSAAEEIEVETLAENGTVHRTIIWVVDHEGDVYLRSVNGAGARWYREATSARPAAIHVDGRRLPVTFESAADAAGIEACSGGLRAKYRRSNSLASMLAPAVLPTTLRVVPA